MREGKKEKRKRDEPGSDASLAWKSTLLLDSFLCNNGDPPFSKLLCLDLTPANILSSLPPSDDPPPPPAAPNSLPNLGNAAIKSTKFLISSSLLFFASFRSNDTWFSPSMKSKGISLTSASTSCCLVKERT